MTIPRSTPLHGTGHTVGEILDAAAEAGGGDYTLPVATSTVLGGVKDGARVTIAGDGTISADVQAGTYALPVATDTVLGGVKQGSGVTIDGAGVISANGGGGGSPQAGQPTRFLTLTYTHPGNEDGNSESATTGIPIPDSDIAEGTVWKIEAQAYGVLSSDPDTTRIQAVGFAGPWFVTRSVGGSALLLDALLNHGGATDTFFNFSDFVATGPAEISGDDWASAKGFGVVANALQFYFWGMSTNTPTDWTINVQLTPLAP